MQQILFVIVLKTKVDNDTIDYNNINDTYPYFDLYSKDYIDYDRPKQTVETIKFKLINKIYSYSMQEHSDLSAILFSEPRETNGKVVLLMHDYEFRKGKLKGNEVNKNDSTHLHKLGDLIDYFKEINFEFKTLDEY